MSTHHSLTPEQLLALLEAVIREAPPLTYQEPLSDNDLRWLGRAEALLELSGTPLLMAEFTLARKNLNSYQHDRTALLAPLHTAYHRIELRAPEASRGAFIPAGDTWNGYAALVKLIQRDCDDLMLIDPYLNASLFTEFAPHAGARTLVRCLTTKRNEYQPGLVAAALRWSSDGMNQRRPLEVRYAPPGSLHDRLIIFDRAETWLISQSLKDIAKRSPASVSRAEGEVAGLKADHYNSLWNDGEPLQTT